MSLEESQAAYDYALPAQLIATAPAHPRDSARLLIFDQLTNHTSFDTFRNITNYLPKNAVLVFNETRVIPARMHVRKQTGGVITLLFLGTVIQTTHRDAFSSPHLPDAIRVLAEGKIKSGDILVWQNGHTFTVDSRDEKEATLTPSFPINQLHSMLERYGETPLPPYMKNSPLSETERREKYQTVFAKENGSVAAPTAGLHFTKELLQKITDHGCAIRYVTLHVNLGTFAPLTEEHLRTHSLHEETYAIDSNTAQFLNDAKREGRPIIAVGTTVVRTLESAFGTGSMTGTTTLFLSPENPPQFVDGLITNFHVPKSSLLMLTAAFTKREKLLDLYQQAIERKFRFFSFGDGMMITATPSSGQYSPQL